MANGYFRISSQNTKRDENDNLVFVEPFLKMRTDGFGLISFIGAKIIVFDAPEMKIPIDGTQATNAIPFPAVLNCRGYDQEYGGIKFSGLTMSRLGVPVTLNLYLYPHYDGEQMPVNTDIPITALEFEATTDGGDNNN